MLLGKTGERTAMAMVDCGTLRGLWRSHNTKLGAVSKTQGFPRARPARVCMAVKLPHSPNDPFLAHLAAAASTPLGQAQLRGASDGPPLLDLVTDSVMMAAPAQVGSWVSLLFVALFFHSVCKTLR